MTPESNGFRLRPDQRSPLPPISLDKPFAKGAMVMAQGAGERPPGEPPAADESRLNAAVVDACPAVIYVKDTKGRYLLVNRRWEALFDATRSEAKGKTDEALFPSMEYLEVFRTHDRQVLDSKTTMVFEESVRIGKEFRLFDSLRFPLLESAGMPEAVCGVLIDVTERQIQLRTLTAGLLTSQEEEWSRIARELHDDLNQWLAFLVVEVERLEQRLAESPDLVRRGLQALRSRTVDLSESVRRMAHQLHPAVLDDLGLEPALRSYCAEFSRIAKIPVTFSCEGLPQSPPPDVALCLYRVAQEALRNIGKHSRAPDARVELEVADDGVRLSVADSGVGFHPDAARRARGLGIASMQERVRLVNGSIRIESEPGKGTRITVQVPQRGKR
jgi:PAS domain S-box-containing protein